MVFCYFYVSYDKHIYKMNEVELLSAGVKMVLPALICPSFQSRIVGLKVGTPNPILETPCAKPAWHMWQG